MTGMAITDHGNMFGIKDFFDAAKSMNKDWSKAGEPTIMPIFGCEVYVAHRGLSFKEGKADMSGWHLILLAKNKKGYQNLIKLVSIGWVDGYYMRPRIDHEVLEKYHENLICCSACLGGEIARKFDMGDLEGAEQAILWHKNLFGDDYYLEMQRHPSKNPLYNPQCYEKQKPYNAFLQQMAAKHDIKALDSGAAGTFSKVVKACCYHDAVIVTINKYLHIVRTGKGICRNELFVQNTFTHKARNLNKTAAVIVFCKHFPNVMGCNFLCQKAGMQSNGNCHSLKIIADIWVKNRLKGKSAYFFDFREMFVSLSHCIKTR